MVTEDKVRSMEEGSQTGGGFVIIKTGLPLTIVIDWLCTGVAGLAQGSLLAIITDTKSPLARANVVKVEAVCPATFAPLIIH